MRGSAQPSSGRPKRAAFRAAWQGAFAPVHPDQEGPAPLIGSPRSDLSWSDTPGPLDRRKGDCPLGTCAHRAFAAWRPEAPAPAGGCPFLAVHSVACRRFG
jgi:hypothetical protein